MELVALIALVLIGSIIFLFFSIIWEFIKYFLGYTVNPAQKKLKTPYAVILEKSFPYYIRLNHKQRTKFQKRLRYFLDSKEFIPKKMSAVTDEMRVLIGSCAVQLTFGLPPLQLMYFNQILVYPDKYKNNNGKFHKGEVNPKYHLIVISWKDFVEGYADPQDAYNVGLHEFAHALKVEDAIRNDEFDFFNTKMIHELFKEFSKKKDMISSGNHPLIRKYAATNFDEFFAVCVEYFFEKPIELYQAEGGIYTILRFMLRQDPKEF